MEIWLLSSWMCFDMVSARLSSPVRRPFPPLPPPGPLPAARCSLPLPLAGRPMRRQRRRRRRRPNTHKHITTTIRLDTVQPPGPTSLRPPPGAAGQMRHQAGWRHDPRARGVERNTHLLEAHFTSPPTTPVKGYSRLDMNIECFSVPKPRGKLDTHDCSLAIE